MLSYIAIALAVIMLAFHTYEVVACGNPVSKKCSDVAGYWNPNQTSNLGRFRAVLTLIALVVIPIVLAQTVDRSTLGISTLVLLVSSIAYYLLSGCRVMMKTKKDAKTSLFCRANLHTVVGCASCYLLIGAILTSFVSRTGNAEYQE